MGAGRPSSCHSCQLLRCHENKCGACKTKNCDFVFESRVRQKGMRLQNAPMKEPGNQSKPRKGVSSSEQAEREPRLLMSEHRSHDGISLHTGRHRPAPLPLNTASLSLRFLHTRTTLLLVCLRSRIPILLKFPCQKQAQNYCNHCAAIAFENCWRHHCQGQIQPEFIRNSIAVLDTSGEAT